MSGYVLAGYIVTVSGVGVYATWVLRRARQAAGRADTLVDGESGTGS